MPTDAERVAAARGPGRPVPPQLRFPALRSADRWMVCMAAEAAGGRALVCLDCGMVSFNPNDVENRYCGACHVFLTDPRPAKERA